MVRKKIFSGRYCLELDQRYMGVPERRKLRGCSKPGNIFGIHVDVSIEVDGELTKVAREKWRGRTYRGIQGIW